MDTLRRLGDAPTCIDPPHDHKTENVTFRRGPRVSQQLILVVTQASRINKTKTGIGIKERVWVPGGRKVSSWHRGHVPSYRQQGGPVPDPLATVVNRVGVLTALNLVQDGPFEYRDWANMYKYIFLFCRLHRQPKPFLFPKVCPIDSHVVVRE